MDLLNLACTCKSLRYVLTNKSALFVWGATRLQVQGLYLQVIVVAWSAKIVLNYRVARTGYAKPPFSRKEFFPWKVLLSIPDCPACYGNVTNLGLDQPQYTDQVGRINRQASHNPRYGAASQ